MRPEDVTLGKVEREAKRGCNVTEPVKRSEDGRGRTNQRKVVDDGNTQRRRGAGEHESREEKYQHRKVENLGRLLA